VSVRFNTGRSPFWPFYLLYTIRQRHSARSSIRSPQIEMHMFVSGPRHASSGNPFTAKLGVNVIVRPL